MPKGEKDILGVNAQITKRVLLGLGIERYEKILIGPSLIENGILSVKDSWWQQKLGTSTRRVRALRKHFRVKLLLEGYLNFGMAGPH